MAVRTVITYGHPLLRKKAAPVTDFSDLDHLIEDMFETMYFKDGIGLAANQIEVNSHLFIVEFSDLEDEEDSGRRIFINSEIIEEEGEMTMEEGCLSIPEVRSQVSRPETIRLNYQDLKGVKRTEQFSGLMARVIQHEIDHLNGRFFTDLLSPSKKFLVKKSLREITENGKPKKALTL